MSENFTLLENASLKDFNTFGIDARAKYLVKVKTVDSLKNILRDGRFNNLPLLILGGGSNILFVDDYFDGLVIVNELKGIEKIPGKNNEVRVKVMAGEVWHETVLYTLESGLSGIENLSLIPGKVGAAPMQNIGAYGVELKEVFLSLEAMEIKTGKLRKFSKEECRFGYRDSIFKNELKNKFIITSITLSLSKTPIINVSYGALKEILGNVPDHELTPKRVSEAVISIRQSKLPDPRDLGNAGSFFKNPEIPASKFEDLKINFPDIVGYPVGKEKIKVPAGWLIEKAGWKGKRTGNVGSHEKQALVIVNYGGATGEEIFSFSEKIRSTVKSKFGIVLEREVNLING